MSGVILFVAVSQCLCGWLCVALAWRHDGQLLARPWRRVWPRALLVGPAAITVQMGLFHLTGVPFSLATVLGPWWLAAFVLRKRAFGRPARRGPDDAPPLGVCERLAFAGALLMAAVIVQLAVQTPVYTADGMNNFALPARVFASFDSLAPERLLALSLPGHLEYPPLVALNSSLFMRAAQVVDPGDPGCMALKAFFVLPVLAFMLLAIELFFTRLRPALALPAAALALCIPTLAATPTAAMADMHLTAALLLLVIEGAALFAAKPTAMSAGLPLRQKLAPFVFAAAVCALTKDEGVALASLSCVGLVGLGVRRRWPMVSVGMAVGAILAAAWSWRAFVAWHGLPLTSTHALPAGGLDEILQRGAVVWSHFARLPWHYRPSGDSPWGLLWPVTGGAVVMAALVALASGLRRASGLWQVSAQQRAPGQQAAGQRGAAAWLVPAVLLLMHLGLYASVYVANTQPLEWVLGTSAPRLFMHVLPMLLLVLAGALACCGGSRNDSGTKEVPPRSDGARNRT